MATGKDDPIAVANRRRKALAMVGVIDEQFRRQHPRLDVFDQAGRILLASHGWSDAHWYTIAKLAGFPRKKVIGEDTRKLVRSVYEGRATAPVERQVAS